MFADPVFNTSLIFGYFYVTLVVLFCLYAGIYKTASDMARRAEQKQRKVQSLVTLGKGAELPRPAMALSKTQSTLLSQDMPKVGQLAVAASDQERAAGGTKETCFTGDKKDDAAANSDQDRSSSPIFDSDDDDEESTSRATKHNKSKKRSKPKDARGKGQPQQLIPRSPLVPSTVPKLDLPPEPPKKNRESNRIARQNYIAAKVHEQAELQAAASGPRPEPPSSLDVKPVSGAPVNDKDIRFIDQDSQGASSPHDETVKSPTSARNKSVVPVKVTTQVDCSAGKSKTVTRVARGDSQLQQVIEVSEVSPRESDVPAKDSSNTTTDPSQMGNQGAIENELSPKPSIVIKLSKRIRGVKSKKEKRQKSKSENRARKALRTISFILGGKKERLQLLQIKRQTAFVRRLMRIKSQIDVQSARCLPTRAFIRTDNN